MKFSVIKQRSLWWSISLAVILAGIAAMTISWKTLGFPLRPGLDFIGGTRLQLELDCSVAGNCDSAISTGTVREILTEQELGNSSIQVLENHILSVRSPALDVGQRTQLQQALNQQIGQFDPETIQIDTVGPTVGQELFASGLLALIVAFFGIIVYLSFRFRIDYAFFAILALFHDVLITAGIFALLGLVAEVEVDSLFLVALLTIIGFSVNDTVVIYDRIRENLAKTPELTINEVVDNSINQTISRSINTTLTTLLPLLAIFLFGGETLKYFALALIIGFLAGAYSSIFIASTLLAWWRSRQGKSRLVTPN